MSSADTWMPLYVGRYLADTGHLSVEEHGAYFLLLMHYWCNGPLPDNDKQLATIARTDRKAWDKVVGPTLRQFFIASDGKLHQKRADIELARAQEISAKKRAAAMARHHPDGGSTPSSPANGATPPPASIPPPATAPAVHMHSTCNADAMHMHPSCTQSAHPNDMPRAGASPLPRPRKKDSEAIASGTASALPLSARDQLWAEGLVLLRGLTGQSDRQARALLGKLLAAAKDDCAHVFNALWEASEARPIDPTAWLMAAVKPRKTSGNPFLDPSFDEENPGLPPFLEITHVH